MKKVLLVLFVLAFFVYAFIYFNSTTTAQPEDLIGSTYENNDYSIKFEEKKFVISKKDENLQSEHFYSKLDTEKDLYKFNLDNSVFELKKMSDGIISDVDGDVYLESK